MSVKTLRNHIDGEWVPASTEECLDVRNPATDEVLARVPLSTAADVDRAVAAAREAFPAWRETPPYVRAERLFRLKEILERRADELARTVVREHGKVLDEARGEVRRVLDNVEVAAGVPTLMMGYNMEDVAAGIDEECVYQPLGVYACVAPFNFPAMVPFWFLPYAVACGDTYVVKPSERCPMSQGLIFEMLQEAGFPPGVLNLVHGDRTAVDVLVEHPDVVGISFVGSTPVARALYAKGAAHGKRMQCQAGAKNGLIVMPDAVLGPTVDNILSSAFGSTGQRCLAGSLVLAVGEVYEPLVEALVGAARALRLGDGMDPGVDVGPVISRAALERIVGHIEAGIAEGARLLLDGRGVRVEGYPHGYFLGPTVFTDVRPQMTVAREEIFGPVLGIVRVGSLDEAIEVLNASPYGNAASIYTASGKAARAARYRVRAGNIGVNIGVAAPVASFPFGGMKASFFGDLHGQGRDAIHFFAERKVVISRWF